MFKSAAFQFPGDDFKMPKVVVWALVFALMRVIGADDAAWLASRHRLGNLKVHDNSLVTLLASLTGGHYKFSAPETQLRRGRHISWRTVHAHGMAWVCTNLACKHTKLSSA